MTGTATRRRPVPRAWRDEHHRLDTRSHAWGYGLWRVSRTRGTCSCGARWPESERTDNMEFADVREAWLDHVEEAYYTRTVETSAAEKVVVERTARRTGTVVQLVDNRDGSFEADEPEQRWATVCVTHGNYILHTTRPLAQRFLAYPDEYCADCADLVEAAS